MVEINQIDVQYTVKTKANFDNDRTKHFSIMLYETQNFRDVYLL